MPVSLAATAAPTRGSLVPIGSSVISGTSTNSVTFQNIPQNLQDLMVIIYTGSAASGAAMSCWLQYNGDGTSNYSATFLYGNGSSALSTRRGNTVQEIGNIDSGIVFGTNLFASIQVHILNYANTSTFKTTLSRYSMDRNGSGETNLVAGLYRSTSAISTLRVGTGNQNFASGSTISLYGVRTVGQ